MSHLAQIVSDKPFEEITPLLATYGLSVRHYKNLYRVCCQRDYECHKTDENYELLKECRGIILEKNTNRIVSYAFDHFLPVEELVWTDVPTIYESVEGSLMKLYWYEKLNRWTVATNRTIDARWAKWVSERDFFHLFMDAGHLLDMEKLDKNCTYSFVLKHPDNRIVRKYKKAALIHIGTRNMTTLQQEPEAQVYFKNGTVAYKPRTFEFKTLEEVTAAINDLPFYIEGFILKDKEGNMAKMRNSKHTAVCEVRGNVALPEYRYLQIRDNKEMVNQFQQYYPEFKRVPQKVEKKLKQYVNKTNTIDVETFVKSMPVEELAALLEINSMHSINVPKYHKNNDDVVINIDVAIAAANEAAMKEAELAIESVVEAVASNDATASTADVDTTATVEATLTTN